MKKLMVALTAVALGACAWAGEAVTPTLTGKVEFKDLAAGQWTPGTGWSSYTGEANTLNIVGEEGSRVLEIQTGTAALTRNVWSDGNAGAIGEGIYIDTTINFQNQALDDVPVATNDEKLAIFVLDTTEIEGAPAGTNVYVLAGYGESGKALYRLAGFDDKIISDGAHRVVVKSYANVIDGGNRTGFLVYIRNGAEETITPCTVNPDGVFVLNADGSVNWTSVATQTDYLGLTGTFKTTAAVARWVDSKCLFLSMPTSTDTMQGNLSAVDFVGNAQIASVDVTATNPGFPADLFTMTVESTGATVELVSGEGVALADGALTATADGVKVVLKVTPDAGKPLVTASGATQNADGNWEFTFANGGTVSFTASPIAAYVGTTPYSSITYAVAAFKVTPGATLKLAQATTWPAEESELAANDLKLDLAGKTLTLEAETTLTVATTGNLTITDSVGEGKIVGEGMVGNLGTLVIEKGIFDVAVANEGTATINGGSFLKSCNSTEGETPEFTLAGSVAEAEGYKVADDGNYWTVQKSAEPTTVSFTVTAGANSTATWTINGQTSTATTITEGQAYVVTFAANEGYAFADDAQTVFEGKAGKDPIVINGPDATATKPTVEPGGETTVDATSEAEALAKVELAAKAPAESGIDDTTYAAYFTKKATEGGAGKYIVTAVLNDEIVQAADVTAEVAAELNAVAADTATAATVTKAKPGLYYSVKYTDNVASMATAAEGDRVMAKGESVEVPMPKVKNANAMFYQVQVNVAPKAQ